MRIILIILDGCPVDSLLKADTAFFDEIMESNYYSLECKAIFPTATFTGHSSIITGCLPNKTGMVANQFYDRVEEKNKHFDNYDPNVHIQAPTIFEYLKNSVSICEPVSKGADKIITTEAVNDNPIESRNKIIYEHTLTFIDEKQISFYMINFSAVDSIGEIYGPGSEKYRMELKSVDKYIKHIYEKSQEIRETVLIISADHGLTNVEKKYDLQAACNDQNINAICLPSHRVGLIYFKDNEKRQIESFLDKNQNIKRIFNQNEIKKLKINHQRMGDLIVVADDYIEFEVDNLKGSHGGLTKEEIHVPLLFYSQYPIQLNLSDSKIIDIFPTILDLLKVKPRTKIDGKSLLK
jgi:predicted AlkP superfamily pyrophosphatase or phosphodiesterase